MPIVRNLTIEENDQQSKVNVLAPVKAVIICVLKFMVCTWPRLKCADKLVTRVISHVHHGPNSITPRKCIVYKKIGSNLASALHPKGTLS